jgi:hypothetical protein
MLVWMLRIRAQTHARKVLCRYRVIDQRITEILMEDTFGICLEPGVGGKRYPLLHSFVSGQPTRGTPMAQTISGYVQSTAAAFNKTSNSPRNIPKPLQIMVIPK